MRLRLVYVQTMTEKLVLILILAGMVLDITSCFLFIRRNKKGDGPSGQPLVTLIACYLLPLLLTKHAVFTSYFWWDCLLLLCFHIILLFVIPIFHRKILTLQKKTR